MSTSINTGLVDVFLVNSVEIIDRVVFLSSGAYRQTDFVTNFVFAQGTPKLMFPP